MQIHSILHTQSFIHNHNSFTCTLTPTFELTYTVPQSNTLINMCMHTHTNLHTQTLVHINTLTFTKAYSFIHNQYALTTNAHTITQIYTHT